MFKSIIIEEIKNGDDTEQVMFKVGKYRVSRKIYDNWQERGLLSGKSDVTATIYKDNEQTKFEFSAIFKSESEAIEWCLDEMRRIRRLLTVKTNLQNVVMKC